LFQIGTKLLDSSASKHISKIDSGTELIIRKDTSETMSKVSLPGLMMFLDAHNRAKYDTEIGGGKVKEDRTTLFARNKIHEYYQKLTPEKQKEFEANLTKAYCLPEGIPNVRKEILSNPNTLDDIMKGTFKMQNAFMHVRPPVKK